MGVCDMQGLKEYQSIKRIHAVPATRRAYMEQMGFSHTNRSDLDDDGYIVIYNKGTPVEYISWSPKEQFDAGNIALDGLLPFAVAHAACKRGERIARINWNGKGMWLIYVKASEYAIAAGKLDVPGDNPATLEQRAWLGMKTVDNQIVPWVASQTDLDADDWVIVN